MRLTARAAARFVGTTLTHNHPKNSMLSGQDVRFLIWAGLRSVRAVTEHEVFEIRQPGTPESLKPNRELADKVMNEYENRFRILLRPYMTQYDQRRRAGESEDRLHLSWMEINRQVGMEAINDVGTQYGLILRREPS